MGTWSPPSVAETTGSEDVGPGGRGSKGSGRARRVSLGVPVRTRELSATRTLNRSGVFLSFSHLTKHIPLELLGLWVGLLGKELGPCR